MEEKFCSCRSNWSYGLARECRRGLVRGMGYTEQEFDRPIVAVINSWNEYNPGHVHLRTLSERVKQGIREAGGLPFEMMTTGICDGMVLRDPKYVELPSRNLIADEVELTVESNMFDAMVLLSTCDSIVPGHLMAAARLDIPAVVVTGGYMPMPYLDGSSANYIELTDHVGKVLDGSYDRARAEREVAAMYGPCGACGVMTTANSMCLAAEALGMSLPGNATASAHSSELLQIAYRAGRQVMELLRAGITARKIITRDAVENAIRETMATAGSTNLLLHLPAIATEAGLSGEWWKLFDEASRKVPLLVASSPSGLWHFQDIDRAGGSRALFAELLPLLHGDALTVTGKTLQENYADAVNFDPRVITTLEKPAAANGALFVLYGTLAPEGGIVKEAAVPESMRRFSGPALVFDTLDQALEALHGGKIQGGEALILRYLGPRARFGTTAYPFQKELKGMGLADKVAIITDGRFSGGSSGLSIGYLSPEAALGSPLALVENGDRVVIDLDDRRLDLEVAPELLTERRRRWSWQFDGTGHHKFLRLFSRNVGSTARGAVWEV